MILGHDGDTALTVVRDGQLLLRYVYRAPEEQLESPRPYFHPVHTLGGDLVTIYRPHDHVWHKGIAWSLPNVGPANFWGGRTYTRRNGYEQLPNNGAMRHTGFDELSAGPDGVRVAHRLEWVTEQGERWFTERRSFTVAVHPSLGAWTLGYATSYTNTSGREVVMGSPTTQGRDNAGYGGLFWRGPRSFTGGEVVAPQAEGGDELMGVRAAWLGFTGRHDGHGRASTLLFVDAPDNPGHPAQWFVRSQMYACVCPAPYFSVEVPVAADETVRLRYAVVVADGHHRRVGATRLAELGTAALRTVVAG